MKHTGKTGKELFPPYELFSFEGIPNLKKQEAAGIKKLKKRIAESEIMVCQTDKSGKLCVMPMEMYIEAGERHTKNNKEVDDIFVKETQKKLNGHVSMWIKATDMGGDWKHGERHRDSQIAWSCLVPPMYTVVKDHKSHDPDSNDPPPTQPICGAVNSMNVNLSNILFTFIEAVADEMEEKAEVISTEDALSRIDKYNSSQESNILQEVHIDLYAT